MLIFEDDFYFVISKEELEEQLERLFTEKPDFDVVMLSYLAEKMEPCETHDFLQKIVGFYFCPIHYYRINKPSNYTI